MKNNNLRRLRKNVDPTHYPANLTECELQVVEAMSEHGYRKVAADRLCISIHTLGDHMKSISHKAGVRNAVLIVSRYLRATEAA